MSLLSVIDELIKMIEVDNDFEPFEQLEKALDNIMSFYHSLDDDSDVSDCEEPPSFDEIQIYKKIGSKFPSFGLYNVVETISTKVGNPEMGIGDAASDLAEIICDMKSIKWYMENATMGDALFFFRHGYRTHWGRHLRELQLFIHDQYW